MDYGAARNRNKRIDKYKPSFLNRNNDRKKVNVALFPPVIVVHFHTRRVAVYALCTKVSNLVADIIQSYRDRKAAGAG